MNRKLVKERSSLFLKEAKEAGLETYPYEAGFFISIPARNAKSVVEYLMKEDIYIVPNRDDCLRVAFSSISLKEVKGLAAKIKEAITHESVLL
jgi:aromatic-amino-acid transaminase